MDTSPAMTPARARGLYPATILRAVATLQHRDVWVAALVLYHNSSVTYREIGDLTGPDYEDLDETISELETNDLAASAAGPGHAVYSLTPFGREMVETLLDLAQQQAAAVQYDPPA